MDELSIFLENINNPDVICLSECRLSEAEMKLTKINKYVLTDYYSRSENTGGGVAIYVKECYDFDVKKVGVPKISSNFEYASVNIYINKELIIGITCIYRAPKYDRYSLLIFYENLENLLCKFNTVNPLFVCGDFNINLDPMVDHSLRNNAVDLLNIFTMFGFKQCIYEYTRVQGNTKSIIDNIFTNIRESDELASQVIICDLSDHYMQRVCFKFGCNNEGNDLYIYKRDFKNTYNIAYFKQLISIEKWDNIDFYANIDQSFNNFLNRFHEILDVTFPLLKVKCKNNCTKKQKDKKWISNDLINEGKFIRDMFKLTLDSPETKDYYNVLKNSHKRKIYNAKKSYYNSLMESSTNKSSTAWQIIKDNINTAEGKRFPDRFVNEFGTLIDSNNEAAHEFNRYFLESIKLLTDNMNIDTTIHPDKHYSSNMFLAPIVADDVRIMLNKLTVKNSAGSDGIPCSLLAHIIEYIANPLCKLINLSFIEGSFPSCLKDAILIPIHKKNEKELISNYRAISLLSVFSKLFEFAYASQLKVYLNKNDILSNSQFGFREGYSTQDAVTSLYTFLLQNIDKKKKCECLFFDMSRAFDTVNHELLLNKMSAYGIRGVPNSWIRSYLKNRTQRVTLNIGGKVYQSEAELVPTGVPQGSTLGPLLFIIFVNDLQSQLKVTNDFHVTQFADDVAVASFADNVHELSSKANVCTSLMSNYCSQFGLKLNGTKTQMLMFANNTPDLSLLVKIDKSSIRNSHSVKLLGLIIDSNLNWFEHIEDLTKKMSVRCYVVWQLRSCVSIELLKMYYFAHVQSLLNYGILCWGNSSRINKLFIMQKKIIRTMQFKHSIHSCRNLFIALGILTLPALYILSCCLFVKSNINQFTQFSNRNIQYSLRHTNNVMLPKHTLSLVSNGVTVMPIKIYNHLPHYLKEITGIKLFKSKVKETLLKKSIYSLQEFFDMTF